MLVIRASSVVVFDLDDTLYPEIDFLKSGFRQIANVIVSKNFEDPYEEMMFFYHEGKDPFKELISRYDYPFSIDEWLEIYRSHLPDIKLEKEVFSFLEKLKTTDCYTGLITDGRSLTQRNKLKVLGLEDYFDEVLISEEFGSAKPDEKNYLYFEEKYPGKPCYYIGNNFEKDFITPNQSGWTTIGVLDVAGEHIHKQDHGLDEKYKPQFVIESFHDLNVR